MCLIINSHFFKKFCLDSFEFILERGYISTECLLIQCQSLRNPISSASFVCSSDRSYLASHQGLSLQEVSQLLKVIVGYYILLISDFSQKEFYALFIFKMYITRPTETHHFENYFYIVFFFMKKSYGYGIEKFKKKKDSWLLRAEKKKSFL